MGQIREIDLFTLDGLIDYSLVGLGHIPPVQNAIIASVRTNRPVPQDIADLLGGSTIIESGTNRVQSTIAAKLQERLGESLDHMSQAIELARAIVGDAEMEFWGTVLQKSPELPLPERLVKIFSDLGPIPNHSHGRHYHLVYPLDQTRRDEPVRYGIPMYARNLLTAQYPPKPNK